MAPRNPAPALVIAKLLGDDGQNLLLPRDLLMTALVMHYWPPRGEVAPQASARPPRQGGQGRDHRDPMTSVAVPSDPRALASLLRNAGFLAAEEESAELLARAGGDGRVLDAVVKRRLQGEPLAWITGSVVFCDIDVLVHPGVYVPRYQSEALVKRALGRLGATGTALEVCTGSGAIAKVLATKRPGARVMASDLDARAVDCAIANGVNARLGDLFSSMPPELAGGVDVVVGVVPYVPTSAMALLPRDTFTFESTLSYDGGTDGTAILQRALRGATAYLRPGGAIFFELGGDQAELLCGELGELGYRDVGVLRDKEGDVRGIEATFATATT